MITSKILLTVRRVITVVYCSITARDEATIFFFSNIFWCRLNAKTKTRRKEISRIRTTVKNKFCAGYIYRAAHNAERFFCSTRRVGGGGWRPERAVQREAAQGSVVDRAPDCGSTRPWVSLCLVAQYCCACARRPIFARAHTHALFTRYDSPSRSFATFVRIHTHITLIIIIIIMYRSTTVNGLAL